MKIRIAGLNVDVQNQYSLCASLCRDYLAAFTRADITVCVTKDEIEREMEAAKEPVTPAEAEFACIYRHIARALPDFDGFVFHAATITYQGNAIAFSAPSGTGKSTHVRLWQAEFGNAVAVLNGDKPIFRFVNNALYAFGTPWCGKEHESQNTAAPLKALVFLERGAQNEISRISDAEAVRRLYHQVLMPGEDARNLHFLSLLDRMLQETPAYLLKCNMHKDAAHVACAALCRENL